MRHPAFIVSAAALVSLSGPAFADTCRTLDALEWVLGEWSADGAKSTFHESWSAVGPKTWEGRGVEVSKSDPAKSSSEELRLVEMDDAVFYLAKVGHNELPVAFRLTECGNGSWVFVNEAHDFPKRLDYLREGDDRLSVRVSDGAEQGFTLNFLRAPAPAAATEAVLAAEDARFAAMVAMDPDAMRRWLAEDLSYVHSTGRVENREQLIETIVSGRLRYLAIEPTERQVRLQSSQTAIVVGIARVQARVGDQVVDFPVRYLSIYGLQDRTWRLRAWQSLRLP